jgi:hypothetical protein
MKTTRRLTRNQKRFIEHVMDFISDIETYESFSVEGQIALNYMGDEYNDISELAEIVNVYIKLLKLEREVEQL